MQGITEALPDNWLSEGDGGSKDFADELTYGSDVYC